MFNEPVGTRPSPALPGKQGAQPPDQAQEQTAEAEQATAADKIHAAWSEQDAWVQDYGDANPDISRWHQHYSPRLANAGREAPPAATGRLRETKRDT